MRSAGLLGVVVLALVLSAMSPVSPAAPPALGAGPAAASSLPPPIDELGRGTPQDSVRGFLEATTLRNYKRASNYLDLRRIPVAERATRGPELAHQLRVVLDNTVFDLGTLSDEPEGRP